MSKSHSLIHKQKWGNQLLNNHISFLYPFLPSLIFLSLSFWGHREQKETFLLWQKVKRYNLETLRDKFPNSWTNVSIVREIKPPRGIKQRWEVESLRALICLVHILDSELPFCPPVWSIRHIAHFFCLRLKSCSNKRGIHLKRVQSILNQLIKTIWLGTAALKRRIFSH